MTIFGAVFGWCYSKYAGRGWRLKYYKVFKLMKYQLQPISLKIDLRARTACMEGHFRPWRKGR